MGKLEEGQERAWKSREGSLDFNWNVGKAQEGGDAVSLVTCVVRRVRWGAALWYCR